MTKALNETATNATLEAQEWELSDADLLAVVGGTGTSLTGEIKEGAQKIVEGERQIADAVVGTAVGTERGLVDKVLQ